MRILLILPGRRPLCLGCLSMSTCWEAWPFFWWCWGWFPLASIPTIVTINFIPWLSSALLFPGMKKCPSSSSPSSLSLSGSSSSSTASKSNHSPIPNTPWKTNSFSSSPSTFYFKSLKSSLFHNKLDRPRCFLVFAMTSMHTRLLKSQKVSV